MRVKTRDAAFNYKSGETTSEELVISPARGGAPETLTNVWLENARNLPYLNLVIATDEIVPVTGPRAQNLGVPESGVKGFDQLGYRFRFLVYDAGEHLAFLSNLKLTGLATVDYFPMAPGFLADDFVNRDPHHITFAYVPAADEPDLCKPSGCNVPLPDGPVQPVQPALGLVHNHAYWVSGLLLADLSRNAYPAPDSRASFHYPAKGVIDVFSHAFEIGDPPTDPATGLPPSVARCEPGSPAPPPGCKGGPAYTEFSRSWQEPGAIPPKNRLDVRLTNLGAAAVDLRRARIDLCQTITLSIDTDSPTTLLLAGPLTAASVSDVSSWEQTAEGVTITLLSGHFDVTIDPKCPDLQVANIVATNNQASQGDKVTITATIGNSGSEAAAASRTEFLLDGSTVLAVVDAPAIPAGGTAAVSIQLRTAALKGEHTIRVTADISGIVAETNEDNNTATLTVSVRGNKVKNGSFEHANAAGTGPDGWSASSTVAGTASWNADDGSVSFLGTGGSTLLSGPPTWTSDPIAVSAGAVLNLASTVQSIEASSATTISLAYLDASGHLIAMLPAITVPTSTSGYVALRQTIDVPAGTAQVRIVLTGFAASDPVTTGKVIFKNVGLFELDTASLDALFTFFDDDDDEPWFW